MSSRQTAELAHELDVAETKAWDSLARYKFMMFGYWAAIWVHLNFIGRLKRPNPWKALVMAAREVMAARKRADVSTPADLPLIPNMEDA